MWAIRAFHGTFAGEEHPAFAKVREKGKPSRGRQLAERQAAMEARQAAREAAQAAATT